MLAIGIVVDDAIVVVENVERVMEENPGLSAAEAAHRAMGEITGAIVAITLVLLSVFVPVAFIPGISGQLFQQFAVAVSVSMVLSAINALTLSPALCAILLKPHHGPKRGPLGWISRRIDGARDGYVARRRRHRPPRGRSASCSSPSPSARPAWLFRVVPTGFLPTEDQGAFFVEVRLPEGASVNRTDAAMRQVETALGGIDGVADVVAVTGYSFLDGLAKSNSGFVVVSMLPFDERTDPAPQRHRGDRHRDAAGRGDPRGAGLRLQPAADHRPRHRLRLRVPAARPRGPRPGRARRRRRRRSPSPPTRTRASARPSPPSRPASPQLFLDLDRERLQTLGVSVRDLFTTLQGTLGQIYVNDFNLFGRTWQVNIQARRGRPRRGRRHRPPARAQRLGRDGAGDARWRGSSSSSGRSRSCATTTTAR